MTGHTLTAGPEARVRAAVAAVPDPELRVLSIGELGVLRDVTIGPGGRVVVTITPTYLGCPALEVIRSGIAAAARDAGFPDVEIVTSLSPPWTTDWLDETARAKLAATGIAPPPPAGTAGAAGTASRTGTASPEGAVSPEGAAEATGVPPRARALPLLTISPRPPYLPGCPRCGGAATEEITRAGATACRSLWRCRACGEPFEHMKGH
ncbi:phenylacetate-CoA oxygenase subunit PaaJ [Streptosporangium nondiastaticum]|uniref:1,2-phenylacetyl-CoA epoxidase subunit PaaD n=1 Tax=Streptosporangium nondiastaticum TaxID=35764 RepID=UPI0031F767FE